MQGLFFVIFLSVIVLCYGLCDETTFMNGKYARCQSLHNYYNIYWNVDYTNDELDIALEVKTNQGSEGNFKNGWVGFGVSVNGGMRGADIALARVVDGKYVLEDRFVPGHEGMPQVDEHGDLTFISATSDDTATIVLYKRKIKSCDVDEDVLILDGSTQVIFAWGKTTFGYHGNNRGSSTIFFHGEPEEKELPDDVQAIQLSMLNYEVPARDTTYVCSPMKLPSDRKYHVVRWRPSITPGNERFVHHMVLYGCPASILPINETYECGMAPTACSEMLFAWTLGQRGDDYLDDHAIPIGAGALEYLYLQVHYNNPASVAGIVDSSGIDLLYTPTLRQYDVGLLLVLAHTGDINIPPMLSDYATSAECPSDCTGKFSQPVSIITYSNHMHQIGKKVWLQHIRNGTELPEMHRDDHYDFTRQQSYRIKNTLIPGDRLIVHCVWDSTSRTTNTTGGETSNQEMCVVGFQYYPLQENFIYCTDYAGVRGPKAFCGGSSLTPIVYPYPEYTPLPAPVSTCPAPIDDEVPSTAKLVNPSYLLLLVFTCLLLFVQV